MYKTKNILSSKINSLYSQHNIDAGCVMTFLLFHFFAEIKNPVRKEQTIPFKRNRHCEKGHNCSFQWSPFDWRNYLRY